MTEHTPSRGRYVRGCRCAGCTEANRLYHQAWEAARKAAGHRLPSEDRAYHAAYMREWRARHKASR